MDDDEDDDDEESGRTMLTLTTASDLIRKYKNQPFVLWSLIRVVRNLVREERTCDESECCACEC